MKIRPETVEALKKAGCIIRGLKKKTPLGIDKVEVFGVSLKGIKSFEETWMKKSAAVTKILLNDKWPRLSHDVPDNYESAQVSLGLDGEHSDAADSNR